MMTKKARFFLYVLAFGFFGHVYAQSIQAPLTINVTSPAAGVPQPAIDAGFTTLVLDYDFTSNTPINWSNVNGWLGGIGRAGGETCPASTPIFWLAWGGNGTQINAPCSAISVEADTGRGGQQALRIRWNDSYESNGGSVNATMIQTCDAAIDCVGNHIPQNAYFEVTGRRDVASPVASNLDFWSYTIDGMSVEWDGVEVYGNNSAGGSTFHNNRSGDIEQIWHDQDPPCCGPTDYTQYHKWAWRTTVGPDSGNPTTINGMNSVWCSYLDDHININQGPGNVNGPHGACQSITPTAEQVVSNSHFQQILQLVSSHTNDSNSNGGTTISTWVTRVRVFSCAGLNSGAFCSSSSANP